MIVSASLLNLVILVGYTLYTGGEETTVLEVSIAFAFIQFIAIIITSLLQIVTKMGHKCARKSNYHLIRQDVEECDEMFHERVKDPEIPEQNFSNTVGTY